MSTRAWAILVVQWRTLRYYRPANNWAGTLLSAIMLLIWYGGFAFLALTAAAFAADPEKVKLFQTALPRGLLSCFFYWQVMPLMTSSMGLALDLKKLLVYPIPRSELFTLEVLLRVSSGIEVLLVLIATGIGLLLNPKIPAWAPLGLIPFIALNLFLSLGVRELLKGVLSKKYFREIAAFLFVLAAALPQVLITTGKARSVAELFARPSFAFLPWNVTALWLQGRVTALAILALVAWTAAAFYLAAWQFARSMRSDSDEQTDGAGQETRSDGWLESLYRLPGRLFTDPLAILMEKEMRVLTRSPRFRLVFVMGFSFGLLIWLPMMIRADPASFIANAYLTIVSLYGLMLLSDVLFWNVLGFDRAAAQIYILAPVAFSHVLIAKNLIAMLFVVMEITVIVLVCAVFRLPLGIVRVSEAYLVPLTVSLFLLAIGNLSSIYDPRATDPAKSFRSSSGGKTRAMLAFLFPLALLPVGLAYLARYGFDDSNVAFYGTLLFASLLGGVVYWISFDSALSALAHRKELLITALSRGDGPLQS